MLSEASLQRAFNHEMVQLPLIHTWINVAIRLCVDPYIQEVSWHFHAIQYSNYILVHLL